MRLEYLRLRNFRQHADTEIHFQPGLTGIIGPNGAGKSTILEGIAWAIYGASAARGTNDTLRFARAATRSRVEAELGFELGGHTYRVVRTLNSAEAFLDGGSAPVAATLGGVTAYLQGRLGMSRDEFFNTYFTGQKELQFLAAMGAADRGRFLSQVLGYERLRRAQDMLRARRSELRHETRAMRATLGDPEKIEKERLEAEQLVADALRSVANAEAGRASAAASVATLAPRWAEAQTVRDRFRELAHRVETLEHDRAAAARELIRIAGEMERVAAAEAEIAPLHAQLVPLPGLVQELEQLDALARTDERRKALVSQLAEVDTDLERGRERLAKVEQAPEFLRKYGAELEALRTEQRQVEEALEEKKTTWLRDKQDAQSNLKLQRDQAKALREQIKQIQEVGPNEQCPTCGQRLGAEFDRVLRDLEDQWERLVQDGKWWSANYDRLEKKPADIAALEAKAQDLDKSIGEKTGKHAHCERAVQELEVLRADQQEKSVRRQQLDQQIAALPTGYSPERHRAVRNELQALRAVETRAARLETTVARRGALERERDEVQTRQTAAAARSAAVAAERDALGFSEADFVALQAEHAGATQRLQRAEVKVTELRGALASAEQRRETAKRVEAELRERMREVQLREEDHRYHDELDSAITELRSDLNAQVRPELAEIASLFLTQLTDGRYTALDIDSQYNILVLDEGEPKPVISGGEEDVANLVLRLAMSQMIAERAGHPLSLLILDEVFGSLDIARRDNVVQLLHRLSDRFEQVILITHIEGIRESLDQVLRVEFDERTGASRVLDESPAGGDPSWEPGLAAD